jgi:2-oxoglutarate dehydrogenase E2 component (dihydrolipoamide succinyltransferase)
MPQLGETVTEGTVTRWHKAVGEAVNKEEILFEVSTDKVDTEIPSPATGYLTEILVEEGATVDVGTKLAVLSSEASNSGTTPIIQGKNATQPSTRETTAQEEPPTIPGGSSSSGVATAMSSRAGSDVDSGIDVQDKTLSPVVRRLIAEHKIDLSRLQGTGLDGRITRADVLDYVDARSHQPVPQPASSSPASTSSSTTSTTQSSLVMTAEMRAVDRSIHFTNTRRSTAEHMVRSKATSAHTLVAMEVDFENVGTVCTKVKEAFKAEYGVSLTYLPFVARAVAEGIRAFPHLNSSVGEDSLIIHAGIHLGIAVDLGDEGFVVPVVHDIATKRLPAIAWEIADLTEKAQTRTLSAIETAGGTFTITNPEPFGTFLTAPIINQPQVAILSTNGIHRRPVVVSLSDDSEAIGIHSVGMFALSFDHRAVDGAYASRFLVRMREVIQTWDWNQEI